MTKEEAEIRSIIADRAKAHHDKNVDLLLAHGGEGFLSFDLAPPLRNKGGSSKEARREIEFATWKGPIGLEERDLVVTAGDNVAFSTSLTHMTGAKTDGAEVSLRFRSTNGFRNENGKWKIVHAHSSGVCLTFRAESASGEATSGRVRVRRLRDRTSRA